MKNNILLLLLVVSLVSCAHKSGHKEQMSRKLINERNILERTTKTTTKPVITIKKGNSNALDGAEIFKRYNSAVFMVFTSDGLNNYQGSGFFIDSEGLAVSNYHVFKGTNIGGENIKLAGNDNLYKVSEVIQSSEQGDFILFRVNCSKTNFIPIAGKKPSVGEKVFAIGSPRGLENTFSSGEVSQWRDNNLMQISALIDHGSSGGALINEYGQVVGITSGSFYDGSQANLNYAWSIDVIKPYCSIN